MTEISIETERPRAGLVARPLRIYEKEGSPVTKFDYARLRLSTFLLDWFIVFYIFYCVDYSATELIRITNIWSQAWLTAGGYVAAVAPYTGWLAAFRVTEIWPFWLILAMEIAALWGCLGVTVGSKLTGLRVVREAQNVRYTWPGPGQRLLRWLGWNLALLSLGLGHLLPLWDDKGQTLADRLAKTLVVPKELAVEEAARGLGTRWYRTSWGLGAALFLALTLLTGYLITEVDLPKLALNLPAATRIISQFFNPNWDIFGDMFQAMIVTIYLALMATVFGVPVAAALSFLGARNMMPRNWWGTGIYYVTRTFFNVFRSIEAIAWAIIFAVWVGIGPFAGTLALGVHTIAALGKLYSEQVENIDMGPVEAVTATGANKLQTIIYAVVPQVIPPFIAFTLYRWDINVRMSTIIGMVGGGGIGNFLIQYQQLMKWSSVGMIVWIIAVVVWILDIGSGKIRERIL